MIRKRTNGLLAATMLVASVAIVEAQAPPSATPSTERAKTIGGRPMVSYEDWAREYFVPFEIRKVDAVDLGNNRVRMLRIMTNRIFEKIGEDEENFIVRELPPDDPESLIHKAWKRAVGYDAHRQAKREYLEDKLLIVNEPETIPPFTDKLRFSRKDSGLPAEGRWQMSFDVADMNGDGRLDLVVPPPRLAGSRPTVFLQQKDGTWYPWMDNVWPRDARLDYGTVRVADFDLDGHLDIAIACHFAPAYVLYGNGKGDFSRFVMLPRANQAVTSRALAVADFNNDGRKDIVLLAEVDVDMATTESISSGVSWVVLNLPAGFKVVTEGLDKRLHGDWLTTADLDCDGWVDIILTSRKMGVRDLIYRNANKGEGFEVMAHLKVPTTSYVLSNAAASLDRFSATDLVLCFEQYHPFGAKVPSQACVVYHFHDAEGVPSQDPAVALLLKVDVEYDNIKGAAIGDIDGDGRNDLAMITVNGQLRIFLQFPDGTLYEERSPEVDLGTTDPFDVKIVDLNRDGKGEVIVMGSPRGQGTGPIGGGFFVFSAGPAPRS